MDPQKTPSSTPLNAGQQPQSSPDGFQAASMQDESRPAPATQPIPDAEEVSVDFNQNAQSAGQPATQPSDSFAPGAMPSLNTDTVASAGPSGAIPGSSGQPVDPDGSPTAAGAAPQSDVASGQPPADPYAAGTPTGAAPGAPAPDGFPNPAAPQEPAPGAADPLGAAQPSAQSSQAAQQLFPADTQAPTIPATAPTPGLKADKKTIFILGGVAVVLIIAIAVLIFA